MATVDALDAPWRMENLLALEYPVVDKAAQRAAINALPATVLRRAFWAEV